jgi:ADP-heptose:LPS heptosyltransferase
VKILIIQLSRFGDLLQTTPMLRRIRSRYPDAAITVLSRYNVIEILRDNPDLDHIELFNIEDYTRRMLESPRDLLSAHRELKDAVARLKSSRFDLVINATHDRFSTFLTYLLQPPEIKGMHLSAKEGDALRIRIDGFWFKYL